jgi:hypothetical protein
MCETIDISVFLASRSEPPDPTHIARDEMKACIGPDVKRSLWVWFANAINAFGLEGLAGMRLRALKI